MRIVWPRDTIARRFALTVVLSLLATVALYGLFATFAGVLAQPSAEESGLKERVDDAIRIIEAAPAETRSLLAAAAGSSSYGVAWYPARSEAGLALADAADVEDYTEAVSTSWNEAGRTLLLFRSHDPASSIPALGYDRTLHPNAYFLAVRLTDQSWLVVTALTRTWGLGRPIQFGVRLACMILAISIVSAIATRQLARPIKQFGEAVRRFGNDPQARPIAEAGPQELRDAMIAFNGMQAQIQKFIADRTTMLAAISHDLRTPLTRMRLRGEFIDDEEQQAQLFRDVDEMQAMVDSALAFFRDDAQAEAATSFDFPELLRIIADEYGDQGIEIDYSGPARQAFHGQPFALKRAFTNLIENALKYGSPPEIELFHRDDATMVAIRDRGPGIAPDALERVFDPFYRLDRSRNRSTGGVGLGLTAARAVIRGHGGDIVLSNRSVGGLEALVTFPSSVAT
jgi:signal transduction histidine kinase